LDYLYKTIEIKNALSLSVFSHEMLYALLEKSVSLDTFYIQSFKTDNMILIGYLI